jgi:hypothetical protein
MMRRVGGEIYLKEEGLEEGGLRKVEEAVGRRQEEDSSTVGNTTV